MQPNYARKLFNAGAAGICLAATTTAHADYYECTDSGGVVHRVYQQLKDRYPAIFQRCDLVVELPEEVVEEEESTQDDSPPRVASLVVVLPPQRRGSSRLSAIKPEAELRSVIEQVAIEYNVDMHLLMAIARVESSFNAAAVSPKGALGLMQIMPATGQRYGVIDSGTLLSEPLTNLRTGAQYIRDLTVMFGDRVDLVLAAYNAGEEAVRRYKWQIPPYPETQNYVESVLRMYEAYRNPP